MKNALDALPRLLNEFRATGEVIQREFLLDDGINRPSELKTCKNFEENVWTEVPVWRKNEKARDEESIDMLHQTDSNNVLTAKKRRFRS